LLKKNFIIKADAMPMTTIATDQNCDGEMP